MANVLNACTALGIACGFMVALPGCERQGEAQPPASAPMSSQSAAPEAPRPVTIELSESDSGATLDIDRGTPLVVHLSANPTTGYSWLLVTSATAS